MGAEGREVRFKFPAKVLFLVNEKWRYKVLRGGRGGLKSWQVARALLFLGMGRKLRILCAREVQKSIKDSVHALLKDQIALLGLGANYDVKETVIEGINGTQFLFTGLSVHTVESIKSFEGIDLCWVEEAQTVSRKSWNILVPTIRKEDSEIWVTFNPDLDSDDTYMRFVVDPPENCKSVEVNWRDNPWFPKVLEQERREAERKMSPDEYANIWEGKCRSAAIGAIYANEMREAQENKRLCNVPYDPMLKAHVVFDLGWNDQMFITIVQRGPFDLRVIDCIVDTHRTLDYYSAELKEKRLNWGRVFLPHDGATKDFKTGKSTKQILQGLGWDCHVLPQDDVESGIRTARMTFPKVYFDRVKGAPLISALRRYRRAINASTNEPGDPLHDEASHGADNFRYLCIASDKMTNEARYTPPPVTPYIPRDPGMGS